jgi:hypothetical protein
LGAATPPPPPPRPPHSRIPGSRRRTVAGRSAGRLPPTGRLALHWHCGSDSGQWHRHHGDAQAREGPRRGSGRPRRGGADDIQACLALAAVDSEPDSDSETVAVKLPVGSARRAAQESKPETPRSHWYFRVKFSHWQSWGSKRPPRRNLSSPDLRLLVPKFRRLGVARTQSGGATAVLPA